MMKRWRTAILWAATIFLTSCGFVGRRAFVSTVGSRLPGPQSVQWFDSFWDHTWWLFVKGWHVTEFAILAVLVAHALPTGGRCRWLLAAVVTATYAISDELHQLLVPHRGGRLTDVLIDCVGVTIGLLAFRWWQSRRVEGAPFAQTSRMQTAA